MEGKFRCGKDGESISEIFGLWRVEEVQGTRDLMKYEESFVNKINYSLYQ